MTKEIETRALAAWLEDTLQPHRFRDYAPNGLQVEGSARISHVVTGVTASAALLQAAVDRGAQAVLVHHGWFWRNESPCLVGVKRARVALALEHNLNLFGFHLPLDAHPVLGNNAQLARVLGIEPQRDDQGRVALCGPDDLVWVGHLAQPTTLAQFAHATSHALGRSPVVVGDASRVLRRIAWCTGGAQNMFDAAIAAGVDAYVTGEISEPSAHLARESGVAFISAGHHATERYGIKALGAAVADQFGITVEFVDLDNPA